jgi:hypothetical protein
MRVGLSDRVRELAAAKYVKPALSAGEEHFFIRVRDLLNELQAEGFPPRHTPQICSALVTSKFLRENGLAIEKVEGPPSLQSPTVVVHYRVEQFSQAPDPPPASAASVERSKSRTSEEDPSERAFRLTEKLRGILKEELAEYGGAEGFIRWIRSDDEEAA